MKQQNDPARTKHYKIYSDSKPTHIRHKEVIDSIPERCWWIRDYLKGALKYPSQK